MTQTALFSPSAFLPGHLAERYERERNRILSAIHRLGRIEALVSHISRALIEHQARLQRPDRAWPAGVAFVPHELSPIVVPTMIPARDILAGIRHGLAAGLMQRAGELYAAYRSENDLAWLVYAAELEGRFTPLPGQALMPDVIPVFDDLWLNVLKRRDRCLIELVEMKQAKLNARGKFTREQAKRWVARWDARLVGLETLLPPGITEATYETYLRLAHDLPEPLLGSYRPATSVLL